MRLFGKKAAACLVLFFCAFLLLPAAVRADHGLPQIRIDLGASDLETINGGDKTVKYPGNHVTIYGPDDEVLLEQSGVEIKGRGNTTWIPPKKPYQIKFEKKQDLFGLGASKKWVLLANYFDATNLRNDFALTIARNAGLYGTTDGTFVELCIDGHDLGLYYLCHKAEIGAATLPLTDEEGVLFELDQPGDDEEISFVSLKGDHFNLKDAVSGDLAVQQKAAAIFEQKWNRFETDAYKGRWDLISEEIDVDSFAKYYLISELGMNLDATMTSFYIHMDGPEDILHAGPAWDYDISFGNFWGRLPEKMWAYQSLHNHPDPNSHILMALMDIPKFRRRVERIWQEEMRGVVLDALRQADVTAKHIRAAAVANNAYWQMDDFDEALAYLHSWMEERITALDHWFTSPAELSSGNYIISYEDKYLTATGLRPVAERVKLTLLSDGFCLIGTVDDSAYLTGTAMTSQYFSLPTSAERDEKNDQEWMIQLASDGKYRFFNKDSGLYLAFNNGILEERGPQSSNVDFTVKATEEQDSLVTAFVQRLYRVLLDREVEQTGLEVWSQALIAGVPAAKIISGVTGSDEFIARELTDEDYIRVLYRALLGREAEEPDEAVWLDVLNQGYSRKKLIEGISGSDEYIAMCDTYQITAGRYESNDVRDHNSDYLRFVTNLYTYVFGRRWDDRGFLSW